MIHGCVVCLWLALCARQDMRQRQIANRLTLGAGLLALAYLLATGTTWLGAPAAQGWGALVLALLLSLPGYALGRLGAGDVKLLAALALASNSDCLLWSLVGASVANVLWLWLTPTVWPLMAPGLRAQLGYLAPHASTQLPFAPFLLPGFAVAWLWIH